MPCAPSIGGCGRGRFGTGGGTPDNGVKLALEGFDFFFDCDYLVKLRNGQGMQICHKANYCLYHAGECQARIKKTYSCQPLC